MRRSLLCCGLLGSCCAVFVEPNPPSWPPSVKVFGPEDESITLTVWNLTRNLTNVTTGHYSDERLALLFKPGIYRGVTISVGYYTQVLGLGERAEDVVFTDTDKGVHCKALGDTEDPGSLDNFWRGAENFQNNASGGMFWAVSQAAPIRRVHVTKNFSVYDYPGWASGGFMADCHVEQKTTMGGQQQFMVRNCDLNTTNRTAMGGQWNLVFVGTTGAPASRKPAGVDSSAAVTNVPSSPLVAEKPFITIDDKGKYFLQVPPMRRHAVGTSLHKDATEIPGMRSESFNKVFTATPDDSSTVINKKLASGHHVVLSPGIYHLKSSIILHDDDQVLLGIGMATLVAPADGTPCVRIPSSLSNVRVAGLMLQAAIVSPENKAVDTSTLLEWGEAGTDPSRFEMPGVLSDIFARVGGPDLNRTHIRVDKIMVIYSDGVVADNLWLWRADHSFRAEGEPLQNYTIEKAKEYHLVQDGEYYVATGLEVFGRNVIAYGLMVEHTLADMVLWHGDGGQVYFYQSEFPYGVSSATYCGKGYSAYVLGDAVRSHQAFGMGAYSYFRDHDCMVESGFRAPETDGIRFTNIFTKFLNGNGGIRHVLNQRGNMSGGPYKWDQGLARLASSKIGECPGFDCPEEAYTPDGPDAPEEKPPRNTAAIVLGVFLALSLVALVGLGMYTLQLSRQVKARDTSLPLAVVLQ